MGSPLFWLGAAAGSPLFCAAPAGRTTRRGSGGSLGAGASLADAGEGLLWLFFCRNSAKMTVIVRVPGLVHASSVVDFEAFKNDDVYKAGPDLGGHDSEMIGGAARGARLEESL